ncbi:hypothetical protein JMJ77_0005283 [Colletotrichum scovillei]|uniref:Uncharacterized protein n=1 Tax=Colletotrichum scovillei TaxID=1209932 RepID=A0A9P7RGF1_9PEZI|nr:hypothetical protein JMJ77_0005283 [Colletotrichum scovillei]KAG7076508.1 hypothetical protein JMJ76_0013771 [Colletotrichum scovillei]KAG7083643.1 hypothetical protein JMJ78_0009087 [Colletotrichum scovillei]
MIIIIFHNRRCVPNFKSCHRVSQ